MAATLIEQLQNSSNRAVLRQIAGNLGTAEYNQDEDKNAAIGALLKYISQSSDDIALWAAIASLGQIATGHRETIQTLIQHLSYGLAITRMSIAECLPKIATGDEEAISSLCNLIRTSSDNLTRSLAAFVLGRIGRGNSEALPMLISLLQQGNERDVRASALKSLREIGDKSQETIDGLMHLIQTGEDYYIRYPAFLILEKIAIGNQSAIVALGNFIRQPELDRNTSQVATITLGKLMMKCK